MHAAKISDVDWKHPVKHKMLEANTLSKVRMGRVDSEWPAKVSRKKALLNTESNFCWEKCLTRHFNINMYWTQ